MDAYVITWLLVIGFVLGVLLGAGVMAVCSVSGCCSCKERTREDAEAARAKYRIAIDMFGGCNH